MFIEYQETESGTEVLLNGVCVGWIIHMLSDQWESCDGDIASTKEECARKLLARLNW